MKKWILILMGTIAWSLTMVKNGLNLDYGMGFWGANGHDGVWHLALIESLIKGSLGMPVFSSLPLQNYHIGFDLIVAALSKLSGLSSVILYFQIIPVVLAFLTGFLTYRFVYNWTKSSRNAWWSTFFVYFGGSLGFVIGKGESAFWSQQAISTLINPPFALSLVFVLLGLGFLLKYQKKSSWPNLLMSVLCFGVLMEIKVYAGLLVLGGLLVSAGFELFQKKYIFLKIFLGTATISSILFFSVSDVSSSILVFKPFWFLETMMGLSDRIGWTKFGEAMVNYKNGRVWFKAILAYTAALSVFLIGNFGTRIIFLAKGIKFRSLNIFFYSVIGGGVIIPMFFLQKGTPWNTIQFFYYSLFFSALLAGISIGEIAKKIKKTWVVRTLEVAIVILTVPTTILTLKNVYLPNRPPAVLPKEEYEALKFLSREPEGVVLTYPFDTIKSKEVEEFPPRPLYLYISTAYVSAFSKHPTFLEDEINLDITGYEWRERRKEVEEWYTEKDQAEARDFFKKNQIKYVYWTKYQRALLGESQLGLTKIYENTETQIYKVDN